MSRIRTLLIGGAAMLAVVPGAARAEGPLITDPTGDATPLAICVTTEQADTCGTERPLSEPSIDIVSGNIATEGNRLVWSLTVVDLEAPASHYAMHAMAGDLGITVALNSGTSSLQVWSTHRGWAAGDADVVLDAATDTVTWTVSLAAIEDLRSVACAQCAPVARGTVLNAARAEAALQHGWGDGAVAHRTYTVGD